MRRGLSGGGRRWGLSDELSGWELFFSIGWVGQGIGTYNHEAVWRAVLGR